MSVLQVIPHVGLSNLRFGMDRASCRAAIGRSFTSFSRSGGAVDEVDAFDDYGVQLNFDSDDRLEFIEAHEPLEVELRGVSLVGRPLPEVVDDLSRAGVVGVSDDVGVDYPDHGFGLYAPNATVEGVSVYPRGYYD